MPTIDLKLPPEPQPDAAPINVLLDLGADVFPGEVGANVSEMDVFRALKRRLARKFPAFAWEIGKCLVAKTMLTTADAKRIEDAVLEAIGRTVVDVARLPKRHVPLTGEAAGTTLKTTALAMASAMLINPDLAYLAGPGSRTWDLLCTGVAAASGATIAEAEEDLLTVAPIGGRTMFRKEEIAGRYERAELFEAIRSFTVDVDGGDVANGKREEAIGRLDTLLSEEDWTEHTWREHLADTRRTFSEVCRLEADDLKKLREEAEKTFPGVNFKDP